MAIWHIDEWGDRDNQSLLPNPVHANYEATLVQADNQWDFQNYANNGDPYDLYYAGNPAAAYTNRFDDASSPSNTMSGSTAGPPHSTSDVQSLPAIRYAALCPSASGTHPNLSNAPAAA